MREIKFRAWDVQRKEWISPHRVLISGEGEVYSYGGGDDIGGFEIDPTLMQYTGLKDKNGKEIYEGDILCVFDDAVVPVTDEGQGPIESCNHLVPVEMKNGVWGFHIPTSDDGETGWYGLHYWNEDINDDSYEIIGNIYQDSHLLDSGV